MAEAAQALPPREYEVIYILRPDITKETAERVAERAAEVISREGGKLTLVENWGRRPMAYEIQHHKRGNYVYLTYLGDGAIVAELERNLRLLDEVMRFQTVKLSDDPGEVEVDESRIKFEAIEPTDDEEEELTLEQELGLVAAPRPRREEDSSDSDDSNDDSDSDSDDSGDEEKN